MVRRRVQTRNRHGAENSHKSMRTVRSTLRGTGGPPAGRRQTAKLVLGNPPLLSPAAGRNSCDGGLHILEVHMRRSLIALATVAALPLFGSSTLDGQSASASLTVTASVAKNCTISTTPVNFGAYDPVAANATAPLDGTGTI